MKIVYCLTEKLITTITVRLKSHIYADSCNKIIENDHIGDKLFKRMSLGILPVRNKYLACHKHLKCFYLSSSGSFTLYPISAFYVKYV